MHINKIKISGFKSIADIELNDLTPYSVFAGANGAGKSNFFDALKFISMVVSQGATQALRHFNGYEHVHCFKHRKDKARTFSTEIKIEYEADKFLGQYKRVLAGDLDLEILGEEIAVVVVEVSIVTIKRVGGSAVCSSNDGLISIRDSP